MIWEALQGETNKAKRKRDKRRPEVQQRGEIALETDKQEKVE